MLSKDVLEYGLKIRGDFHCAINVNALCHLDNLILSSTVALGRLSKHAVLYGNLTPFYMGIYRHFTWEFTAVIYGNLSPLYMGI